MSKCTWPGTLILVPHRSQLNTVAQMQSYDHRAHYTPQRHSSAQATPSRPPQIPPRPRHASFAASESLPPSSSRIPQLPIPSSLTPGRQRAARPSWDASISPSLTSRASSWGFPHPSPAGRVSLYGDYFSQPPPAPVPPPPPLPQKPHVPVKLRPPIPPKPFALIPPTQSRNPLYPQSIPTSIAFGLSPLPSDEPRIQSPTSDDREFPLLPALTASESKHHEDDLAAQEEEDLARALEESRLSANVFQDQLSVTNTAQKDPASTKAISSGSPAVGESWLNMDTPSTSQHSQDSLLEETSLQKQPNDNKDVAYQSNGRSLNELFRSAAIESRDLPLTSADSMPTPSLYSNVVSNLVAKSTFSLSTSSITTSTVHVAHLSDSSTPNSLTRPPSEPPVSPQPTAETYPRSPSIPSVSGLSSNFTSDNSVSLGRLCIGDVLSPATSRSPVTSASSSLSLDAGVSPGSLEGEGGADLPKRPAVPYSANQYVEPELLIGVSLGFSRPVISTMLTPMKEQMPNVITLPYGKAPPCFLQAPNWRRLLKLMARLSATRIEPTVEALSIAKHELKLRTVVQFVRVHHSSSDWRTVLYFTTDMPVSPSVHNSHKYTNGDVGVLPFSYTLSPLPTLLRDGAESSMTKYYVIPSTPTTPYPTLPIDFPNLAMYLQTAVDDSRRAATDGSGGMRKLAQFIDSCYPGDTDAAVFDGDVPSRGVGGMLKRVIRRSKGKGSRGNEEIYDLVTPFVADEWG